ncbi:murein transglycosylase A [Erythrobacter sp. THAF29]|uniref:murein transglycosylase A n=1 Tax=Erythrobacter sp. THAF29 TaxID=2587851 RepID=UPI001268BEC9|nr:MltA domain-containing protein [Erythrobacter sp. THAF29]QFT78959.1 Membrane-bound lytic murein transglycosylase A precursor [Erythrobacter sp. THAF29]
MRTGTALAIALLLTGCGRLIPEATPPVSNMPAPPAAAVAASAFALGATPLSATYGSRIGNADAAADLEAFLLSCPIATSRDDRSGLTRPSDWNEPCEAAARWPRSRAAEFFSSQFTPVRVGDGAAFATGYFEPQIRGSRTRLASTDVPVYGVPADLVRCWRDGTPQSKRQGRPPLGRRAPDGSCVPYYTRAEIERGALDGKAPVIGYASDPIEFFFLQIQGSGRLVTETGEVIRIGYAGQNGHSYTGIGGVMRERGLFGDGPGQYPGSMQGIMQYLRENPREGADLMRMNESWVFFRELNGEGPLGSIGVPVRARNAVAVDPRFVPYGAPVYLDLDRDEADGIWIAQDTGGAIKGANRFDTFWGAGDDARRIAGGMSGRGEAVILLPRASAERLRTNTSSR